MSLALAPGKSSALLGSVQRCSGHKGALCVVVTRRDRPYVGIPGVAVSVQGPTPGRQATDDSGIAEFAERAPGAYRFNLELSGSYSKWRIAEHSSTASVAAGQVSIVEAHAYPVGTLIVEIRTQGDALLRDLVKLSVSGAATFAAETRTGTHVFADVACGEYLASGALTSRYTPSNVTAPKVVVPEGGSATAQLRVGERTWVEVELLGEDGIGIAGEAFLLVTPEGREVRGKTDARGRARVEDIPAGQCRISFPRLDKEAWRRL
jgi:hypothetical protein